MAKTPILLTTLRGPKGDTGSQGVQGPQGVPGNTGSQGAPGPTGPSTWAGGVFSVGQISGTWAPTVSNGPDQEATLNGAATLNAPSTAGTNGQKVQITFSAVTASQVLTFGLASRIAGWPSTVQIAVSQQVWVILRYSTTFSKWSIVSITQEG